LVAITKEGVLAPTEKLRSLVLAFGEDGALLTGPNAVPAVTPERAWQLLFGEWVSLER
jgi:hypothetical protein